MATKYCTWSSLSPLQKHIYIYLLHPSDPVASFHRFFGRLFFRFIMNRLLFFPFNFSSVMFLCPIIFHRYRFFLRRPQILRILLLHFVSVNLKPNTLLHFTSNLNSEVSILHPWTCFLSVFTLRVRMRIQEADKK